MNILGHRLLVVTRHWLGRLAEAAQVRRDYGMTLCQLSHQWPPHVTVLGVAMQQQHRIAFTGDEIVKSHSVTTAKRLSIPVRICAERFAVNASTTIAAPRPA